MKLRISASLCTITALGALLAGGIAAQPSKPPAKKSVPTKAQVQKSFPNASSDLFNRGRQVTVFWIEPFSQGPGDFHGYHIRGQHNVTSIVLQDRIKAGIEEAIATDPGFGNACFHPVHGLRVSDGNHSVDLLVCFGCCRLAVFSGQSHSFTTIGGSGDTEMLLNRVLRGDIQ